MKTKYPFINLEYSEVSQDEMIERSECFYRKMRERRTVRDLSNKIVPMSIIENVIATAGTAPSGANMQPWQFIVVTNSVLKNKIRVEAEKEEKEFYEHRASQEWLDALAPLATDQDKPFLEVAPILIVIFLKKFSYTSEGKRLKNYYTSESVGIATGLLITALHNAGLVTLTHTPSPMKFLNTLLDRPKEERPYMIVVAGYPAQNAEVPDIVKRDISDILTLID